MGSKEDEVYKLKASAAPGETITLTNNSTTVYSESVPAWATRAEVYFQVHFIKE